MKINRSQIIDNWVEILLETYEDSSQGAMSQTQMETNEEWRNCFMIENGNTINGEVNFMKIDGSQIIDNWADILLETYEDASQGAISQTQMETNEEWRNCFMIENGNTINGKVNFMKIDRSQIIDNWVEILLETYEDSSQGAMSQTQMETNEEWRNCFMIDFEYERIFDKAA